MIDIYDDSDYTEYDAQGTPDSFLLKRVREAGFKPIGITTIICEETFIFKSKQECAAAAKMFPPEGWWYDFAGWEETRKEYVKIFYAGDDDIAPTIYWLDFNFTPKKEK